MELINYKNILKCEIIDTKYYGIGLNIFRAIVSVGGVDNRAKKNPYFINLFHLFCYKIFLYFGKHVHKQFAKVCEQCLPRLVSLAFGKHCLQTVCQSLRIVFAKSSQSGVWQALFANILPKFANSVCQEQSVTGFGKHCSQTLFGKLFAKVFENFLAIMEHWVLRIPGDLGLEDDVGTNPDEIGVLKPVDEASSTSNVYKETLQTCLGIVGVDDCPKLIAAVKKYKDHEETMLKVLESEAKLAVATQDHKSSVRKYEELNPALQAIITSSTGKAQSSGGSFKRPNIRPGKNERIRKKLKAMGEVSATSSFCSSMHQNQ